MDWAQDVFPALLEQDVPFYVHEIDEYWNDVGLASGVPAGQLRRARGEGAGRDARSADGASIPSDAEVEGSVFIGEGCEIASGVRLTGPVVIGERLPIGEGAALRETIVWPGTEVDAGHGADRRRGGRAPAGREAQL